MSEMSAKLTNQLLPIYTRQTFIFRCASAGDDQDLFAATRNSRSRGDTRQVAAATVMQIDRVTRAILSAVHLTG